MKNVNKLILVTFLLVIGTGQSLMAQNTGFGGKRWVFKTKVVNGMDGFLSGGGIEYVFNDYWTLSAGVSSYSKTAGTDYSKVFGFDDEGCLFEKKVDEATDLSYRSVYLEGRFYFQGNENFMGAPKGTFFSLQGEAGLIDMKGDYHLGVFYKNRGARNFGGDCSGEDADFHEVEYEYRNINFYSIKTGLGYQHFFTPWLTASIQASANLSMLQTEDEFTGDVIQGVKNNINSNIKGFKDRDVGLGFSANIQVGVMFF